MPVSLDYMPTSKGRSPGRPSKKGAEERGMKLLRDVIRTQEDGLYDIHAEWYEQIQFVSGLQHMFFHKGIGRTVPYPQADDHRVRIVYNEVLPIVEGQQALLLSRDPKRKVVPLTDNEDLIDAAEFANGLLDWAVEYHTIEEVAMDVASWLAETGNAFIHVGWDPTSGREMQLSDGSSFFEGNPILEAVPPFQIGIHPHAKKFEDSPYCTRQSLMPKEWLEAFNKKAADQLGEQNQVTGGPGSYELELLNYQPRSRNGVGYGSIGAMVGDVKSFFTLWQLYLVPTVEYPDGLFIMAAGIGNQPEVLVHYGPNPYKRLPFVHFKMLNRPGRMLGDCYVPHLMPANRAFNRFNGQLIENGNFIANPMLFVPHSIPGELVTNIPGEKIPFRDGLQTPPFYLTSPPLPPYVIDARNTAREYMASLASPVGPDSDDMASRATSGIQLSLIEEMRSRKVAPMIRRWELAWEKVWKHYLLTWAQFQRVPREINAPTAAGDYRAAVFLETMNLSQIQVKVERYSAMPTSRVATFAEWVELVKSGAADVQTDMEMRRQMFDDIGKGHMVRGWKNFNADMEKARRNLHAIRSGQQGKGPEQFDDLDAHLSVYSAFQKTAQFDEWIRQNPAGEQEFWTIVNAFQSLKDRQERARLMQAMMLQGGGSGGGFPFEGGPEGAAAGPMGVQAAAETFQPGAPQGGANPTTTQGFGNAPNPYVPSGQASPDAGLMA